MTANITFQDFPGENCAGHNVLGITFEYFTTINVFDIYLREIFEWCDTTFNTNAGTYNWDYKVESIDEVKNIAFKWYITRNALITVYRNVVLTFKFITKEDQTQFILTWG